MKNRNGITLIALVITVLIIIILAGVSLNIILGENGIMNKAKIGREQHKIEDIRERLDLVKGSDYIKEQGKNSIDTYFETLNKEKIKPYEVTNTEKLTNYVGSIEVDNKYSYLITIENNKDIKIEYEGKIEEIDRLPDEIEIEIVGEREQPNLPVSLVAKAKTNGNIIQTGKFIINNESEKIGTEENLYTNEISNGDINITVNEVEKNYYIHTLTLDRYGRKQESVKGPIVVMNKYHEHKDIDGIKKEENYNSLTSGGCFTNKISHIHSNNCKAICGGTYNYVGTFDGTIHYKCNRCGNKKYPSTNVGSSYYGACQERVGNYVCGISVGTYYKLNCGKTETTVESYTVNY